MQQFLERLVVLCPELYGNQALGFRCLVNLIQVVAGFFLFLILGRYASPDDPTLGQAAIVFLLMGCWALTTGFQLERMYRLVVHLVGRRTAPTERLGGERSNKT